AGERLRQGLSDQRVRRGLSLFRVCRKKLLRDTHDLPSLYVQGDACRSAGNGGSASQRIGNADNVAVAHSLRESSPWLDAPLVKLIAVLKIHRPCAGRYQDGGHCHACDQPPHQPTLSSTPSRIQPPV